MDLSVVRSAVSEDSPRGHGTVRYDELSMEVDRLRRRNGLLDKGRKVLEEEVRLYRDEIQSKNRKIQLLSTQTNKAHNNIHHKLQTAHIDDHHSQMDLILLEKEEQLGVASEALLAIQMRVEQLQTQNKQLREQLSRSAALLPQLKQSSKAQLNFQHTQIAALEQELLQKDREIVNARLLAENLTNKENTKWHKIVQNLREQIRLWEEKAKDVSNRQEKYSQERQQLKEKNESLKYQVQNLKQKIIFLESLLEEAKGAFIDVQLQQQEQLEKQHREKREYRKRNQLLKTQIKSLRGNSDSISTYDPSNKSTRTASTVSVTPFRTSSCRSKQPQQ